MWPVGGVADPEWVRGWSKSQDCGDVSRDGAATVVDGGLGVGPGVGLQAHVRDSVLRLNAVASSTNSALTLAQAPQEEPPCGHRLLKDAEGGFVQFLAPSIPALCLGYCYSLVYRTRQPD